VLQYKVKQGDCLSRIAQRFHYTVDKLSKLPENKHLQENRRTKDILFPGDIVYIPEIEVRSEKASSGARHKYKLQPTPKMEVALCLMSEERPRVKLACKLVLEQRQGPANVVEAFTDENGVVRFDIPLWVNSGVLKIDACESYHLLFANLDPVTTVSGAQQRLANLGHFVDCNNKFDENTQSAFLKFQKDEGITESGLLDDEMMTALENRHGV
jgi:N-acetylmuramoyl-L-alanine amidase